MKYKIWTAAFLCFLGAHNSSSAQTASSSTILYKNGNWEVMERPDDKSGIDITAIGLPMMTLQNLQPTSKNPALLVRCAQGRDLDLVIFWDQPLTTDNSQTSWNVVENFSGTENTESWALSEDLTSTIYNGDPVKFISQIESSNRFTVSTSVEGGDAIVSAFIPDDSMKKALTITLQFCGMNS